MSLRESSDAWARLAESEGAAVRPFDDAGGFRQALLEFCARRVGAGTIRGDDGVRERATRRLAAGLAGRWGLCRVLGLGSPDWTDPVFVWEAADRIEDPSARELAIRGWHEAADVSRRPLLDAAFDSAAGALGARPHPLRMGECVSGRTCGDCAWNRKGRCLQVGPPWGGTVRVPARAPACPRWESVLDDASCATCGACCREGYSMAPVRRGETMAAAHPEWIVGTGRDAHLPRPRGRCVALDGDGSRIAPWRCRDYAARPRACSGLDVGGRGCLEARRRVGLSIG